MSINARGVQHHAVRCVLPAAPLGRQPHAPQRLLSPLALSARCSILLRSWAGAGLIAATCCSS